MRSLSFQSEWGNKMSVIQNFSDTYEILDKLGEGAAVSYIKRIINVCGRKL